MLVLPLGRVDAENGATAFAAGSHRETAPPGPEWPPPDADAIIQPELDAGGLLFFDLRTRHRGAANGSPLSRTIIYASFVRDWFVDAVNFKEPHSAAFDALPFLLCETQLWAPRCASRKQQFTGPTAIASS